MVDASEHLAVGLDVPDLVSAKRLAASLAGHVGWLKVGSELFSAAGPAAVEIARDAARVFLDLKFHDIPHTVAGAVRVAARLGVGMLTVHTAGGGPMLRAARMAAEQEAARHGVERPRIVGVTVLTSLAAADLKEVGVSAACVDDQVARLVELAVANGLDAVVASPREVARVRAVAGDALSIVTPGIRSTATAADDQIRTASAAEAIAAGSDVLVVARPVIHSADPVQAVRDLLVEIETGLAARSG
ncbi:MAG: orotidine-5'-phosphate decarboxylase [Deltaproteobacteria bacterium]|nr:orotidine-5'-phosphate decarboxylase [Deltaproteobacteria bacterium]